MTLRPFHLAIPVDDLVAARGFYGGAMGCAEGRSSDEWVDFDFFGHQLVVHVVAGHDDRPHPNPSPKGEGLNVVDGHDVPVPHFGVVLTLDQFDALAERLAASSTAFVHPPMTRFAGLEFKAFADDGQLFAR
jgi:uncharacterized protein